MTVLTDDAAVRAVQTRLKDAGLYAGEIDGRWGGGSAAALEAALGGGAPDMDPALFAQLRAHEGLRLKPYRDTVGKLTVGIGRNLDDVGLREAEAKLLCANDVREVEAGLDARLPWWRGLDASRRAVLTDMAFNLGLDGLLGFHTTLSLVEAGRFAEAAQQMLRSKWASQVGRRAATLSRMMRTGETFEQARAA